MRVLNINDNKHNLGGFPKYLKANHSDIEITDPDIRMGIKKQFYSKKKMAMHLLQNFFRFLLDPTIFKGGTFDFILLNGILSTIPYLMLARLCPFIKPKKNIIVSFFFVHNFGNKRLIQLFLKFLFDDEKIVLTVHSKHDIEYFGKTVGLKKGRVIVLPYCQDYTPADERYGIGQDYIFTGGYSNRDYECVLEAAKNISYNFIIACSDANKIPFQPKNVKVLRNLTPNVFNSYLKNSTMTIIPLKHNAGSSGHAVALSAMSFKKPIIYSDMDGLADYFVRDASGIVYKRGDANDLTDKIKYLLANPKRRDELGNIAFSQYNERYQKSNYYEYLVELFRNLQEQR